ncbi:NAD(P)-binding domain-containing protein [Frigidibacter sp. RF13]|uniref:pyrroline-5-carboxylate reductase dimerization domain-containing protein n=1 Tax=Frigidibacter sp. RF13 TaxID=2997340 RepID=UPI002271D35C|nr:pyrroline-5-carboxylate reductase dimerization domain-containing protein [Frigidibacter sp. RF13]MCY1128101.1 NAD(P)-binding domain-containing protein [Frigidibacter sp. RF13]
MTTVGFLGVGGLVGLLMRGLQGSPYDFLLSPRGAETAGRLAADHGCAIAASNQEVVDRSDALFVALPAASGADELARLTFRPGQPVLSAMAGTGLARLQEVIGPAKPTIGMMPGYANAYRLGPSILCPDDTFWRGFLSHIGPVHVFADEQTFTAAATFGAFSGATVGWMTHIIRWFEAQGLPPDTARALVAGTLRGNAEVLLNENRPLADIAKGVTTPGGITLQLLDILTSHGALDAWDEGLDAVLRRISGPAA